MTNQTQFVVRNNNLGSNDYIYVFLASYEDINRNSKTSRQQNVAGRQVAPGQETTKNLEVSSEDDGGYYLAVTFKAATTPGSGVSGTIYVGPPISNPNPAANLIRELRLPEGFKTTLIVSPNGFSMVSEKMPQV